MSYQTGYTLQMINGRQGWMLRAMCQNGQREHPSVSTPFEQNEHA